MNSEIKEQHSFTTVKNMAEIHENALFTDVIIICGSLRYPAHKIVLAAHSPYMKAMFLYMKKNENSEVEIKAQLDPNATEQIFNFMYNGEINLDNYKNMLFVLESADFLQVNQLKELCCNKVQNLISPRNFLDHWLILQKYSAYHHIAGIIKYLSARFYLVQTSDDFFQLPLEFLKELMRSECFPLSADETVVAVLNWVKFKPDSRIFELKELLSEIHFYDLRPAFVIKFLEDPILWQVPSLQSLIKNAVIYNWWKRRPFSVAIRIKEEMLNMRFFDHYNLEWVPSCFDVKKPNDHFTPENIIHMFAFENIIYFFTNDTIHFLNIETKMWQDIKILPECSKQSRGLRCNGYLYLLDSTRFRRINVESSGQGWTEITALPEYSDDCFAIEFDGSVYVISKKLVDGKMLYIYKYDVEKNSWNSEYVLVNGSLGFVNLCVASVDRIYLMTLTYSTKIIYALSRVNNVWVVSLIKVDVDGLIRNLFYNSKYDNFHLCNNSASMYLCSKKVCDSTCIIDTVNGFYKVRKYSACERVRCETFKNSTVDFVVTANFVLE